MELEAKRKPERKETNSKPYKQRSCGMRDTTWLRMAVSNKTCSEGYLACSRGEESLSSSDHSFGSEAARKTFRKFQRFSVSSTDEASLCASYRFDAVIAHAVVCIVDIASNVGASTNPHQNV